MITMDELLNYKYVLFNQPSAVQDNLQVLLSRANDIRARWKQPMKVTSGLRSMEDHLRIYAAKGITDPARIPMRSKHLTGQAVDIFDPGLEITAWLKNDPTLLEEAVLWCEDGNANWVHFQTCPPMSGKRWFLP